MHLDPWQIGETWTWPHIWLTVRHLEDEARHMRQIQRKPRSGQHKRGNVHSERTTMKYTDWIRGSGG